MCNSPQLTSRTDGGQTPTTLYGRVDGSRFAGLRDEMKRRRSSQTLGQSGPAEVAEAVLADASDSVPIVRCDATYGELLAKSSGHPSSVRCVAPPLILSSLASNNSPPSSPTAYLQYTFMRVFSKVEFGCFRTFEKSKMQFYVLGLF